MNTIIVLAIYGVVFGIGEALKRYSILRPDDTRSLVHIIAGVFSALLPFLISKETIVWIAVFFFVFLLISKYVHLLQSIHDVQRKTIGEFLFPVYIGLAAVFFLPLHQDYYLLSILILALSDSAANMAGRMFGGPKLLLNKTLYGSFVFFLTCLIISLFFLNPPMAVLFSLVVTLVEGVSPYGLDNITMIIVMIPMLR